MPIPSETHGKVWIVFNTPMDDCIHLVGIFLSREEAIKNSRTNEGIALVPFGSRLPYYAIDLEAIYWPHKEKWETTSLFHWQQKAKRITNDFFARACQNY